MAADGQLPMTGGSRGVQTFDQWLAGARTEELQR